MAENVVINVTDRDTAEAWLDIVKDINTDYNTAMINAGQSLDDIQNFADGTLVDEFVDLGSKITKAGKETFEAIRAIADTVSSFLGHIDTFKEAASSVIKGTVNKLFGGR